MRYEIILDIGETPNKCTIAPLRHRTDFSIHRVTEEFNLGPLNSSILLHPQGSCLLELRGVSPAVESIAAVDCIWRRLGPLMRRVAAPIPALARIPDGFVTAYPRKSLRTPDPAAGLATIEALFTASALLGSWDASLFSEYYFGYRFVELNARRFLELGVAQAGVPATWPRYTPRLEHSIQRRVNRGRPLPAHLYGRLSGLR